MDNKTIKLIAGILLGMMFFIGAPVYAQEQTEVEETVNEEEMTSLSECQNDFQTVTETMNDPQQLTITMKGVTDENCDKILNQIEQGVDIMTMYNGSMRIEDINLPDPEKYFLKGYDSDICWAASAADMLWISGYAQDALNQETGDHFQTVDEVFDYFRKNFEDHTGNPKVALDIFFTGDADSASSSWLKPDAKPQPLVSEEELPYEFVSYLEDYSYIREFEDLKDRTFGVVLHSIDNQTNQYAGMGHVVSVVGIVYDEKAEEIQNRYKAVLIADSDNDSVLSNSYDPTDYEIPDWQKAQLAANAKNSYTLYTLKLKDYGEHIGYKWAIPYYPNPFSKIDVIIDAYAYLKDKRVPEKECPKEEPVEQEISCIRYNPQNRAPQPYIQAEAFIYSHSYADYDFAAIKKEMEEKKMIVYLPEKYSQTNYIPFHIFIRKGVSRLKNILLDGQPLLFCYMDMTESSQGIFVIEINEDLMQKLSSGEHILTVQIKGQEDIIQKIDIE